MRGCANKQGFQRSWEAARRPEPGHLAGASARLPPWNSAVTWHRCPGKSAPFTVPLIGQPCPSRYAFLTSCLHGAALPEGGVLTWAVTGSSLQSGCSPGISKSPGGTWAVLRADSSHPPSCSFLSPFLSSFLSPVFSTFLPLIY